MMMTANLIGFVIGTDGMGYMWSKMVGSYEGVLFLRDEKEKLISLDRMEVHGSGRWLFIRCCANDVRV